MFRYLEKVIPKQSWYESGYRANIIVYTISFLNLKISEQFSEMILDRNAIWTKQGLSDSLETLLIQLAEFIFNYITDESRPVMNVTEWCKHAECWERCKKLDFVLLPELKVCLAYIDDVANAERAGHKDRKMLNGIESQVEVVNKGSDFWRQVALFAVKKKILSEKEMGILKIAVLMDNGRPPSDKQSAVILSILEKAKDEGFAS